MVKRYYGGVISATQAVVSTASATGFFNVTQQTQAVQAGIWPLSLPPPPPENTAAWFGGGTTPSMVSRVDRITFATDTATASVRGPLSSANQNITAAGNTTDGWFGGGLQFSPSFSSLSRVDRITYTNDTVTASVRGPLSLGKYNLAAAGNQTDGWFGGGYYPIMSTVDRITYATDTATASVRGPLSRAIQYLAAAGNTTNGWFGGGSVAGSVYQSTVDRISYATDTDTASVRGPLSVARRLLTAVGNTTDGWFGGGYSPAYYPNSTLSLVDRITYATDTATASVRGPLSVARLGLAAAGDSDYGWFGGGAAPGSPGWLSTVDRITYATDTATASVRGPLSLARDSLAAAGGVQ